MGGVESKEGKEGTEGDDVAVHELAPDTLCFMGTKASGKKPYIISKRSSPFVQFCLLAEELLESRDRIVRAFTPKKRPPPSQNSFSESESASSSDDDDDDDGAGVDFGLLGDDRTQMADPELGVMPAHDSDNNDGGGDRMRMADMENATPIGGNAVEANASAEIGSGLRNRTQSPTRSETWSIDLGDAAAMSPPQSPRRSRPARAYVAHASDRPARPFGDVNYSKVAKMLPVFNNNSAVPEREQYCRIDHVELWSAYRVFVVFREEEAGLMRAIKSGAIDLVVHSHEPNADAVLRQRIDDWRAGYAESLNMYNNVTDTFVAKAGIYLTMAGQGGDQQAAALAQMAHAVNDARKTLLPHNNAAEAAEGRTGDPVTGYDDDDGDAR